MWLLLAFIAIPMIEITLFIQVGGLIGIGWTLLIVLATAIAGSYLVRQQGLRELGKLQQSFSALQDPTEPLANGAMILFAGALLLTPGFFTDVVGLSLLVPQVRHAAYLWGRSRINVASFSMGAQQSYQPRPDDQVIDGEFQDITGDKKPTHPPSGWTRH
ncbi:FxsA family protein [Loktanella sp. S4079]|uniref:FxsA family protein n=1 Tax=Loktanella sp. S4079 TaxID=579483 RepID=UPI0005FA3181|nr:FxsA family protein [Loktanella sp. S4079]KJZ19420.1 exlusion protein FxsA [Loktanella sp. S4079]